MAQHQGKMLELFITERGLHIEKEVLPKLKMSRGTFFALYHRQTIDKKHIDDLMQAGIDFLGQSPATKIAAPSSFPQKESGLSERVRQLESQLLQVQAALLDLYSRLPKQP